MQKSKAKQNILSSSKLRKAVPTDITPDRYYTRVTVYPRRFCAACMRAQVRVAHVRYLGQHQLLGQLRGELADARSDGVCVHSVVIVLGNA